ncbi:L,D-transpeptidase family protein [Actinoallomurus sp. NPDC052274]|uniref:L,D-transpeptidase family protein n=1 Tax=Actinoallomurus sp. NPDC052274 TaxID=3155420 RepID=UPI00342285FD
MRPHRTALLASLALAGGAMFTGLAPAAQGQTFDPCSAANQGKLRYPTGSASHVVFAISSSYDSNHVVVTECAKQGKSWKKVSVTTGRAGTAAFARPGAKREGDGKTPTGSFTLTEAFGIGNPGTKLKYRTLRDSGDCWGATPGKSHYNEYYSGTCRSTDENLSAIAQRGPYRQVVVINYNRPNAKSGLGSAIFFHVGGINPTAGCVSIREPELRAVMRTLVPNDRMIMGPRSALFHS